MKRLYIVFLIISCSILSWIVSCSGSSSSAVPTPIPTVETPVVNPAGGTFDVVQYIQITCATPGSVIRYTTNGTIPSESSGTIINPGLSVAVSNTQTIRALAYKSGYTNSRIAEANFVISSTVANTEFSVSGGTYPDAVNVAISCATSGVTIRYTTDGNKPSRLIGTIYTGTPIQINQSSDGTPTEIKAIAYKEGCIDSSISSASYLITGYVKEPVFTPASESQPSAFSFSLFSLTAGSVIRYTIDGNDPTRSSGIIYNASVPVVEPGVLVKAIAYVPSWNPTSDSQVVLSNYTIDGSVSAPICTLSGTTFDGSYLDSVTLSLSCDLDGATIKYTIDNEDLSSALDYTVPIIRSLSGTNAETHTLRAFAVKNGYHDSALIVQSFTITSTVANPQFSLAAGYYTNATSVTLNCPTPDSEIFYTINGGDPSNLLTTNVILYTEPITVPVGSSYTIRVYAKRFGWKPSGVIERNFTVTGKIPNVLITPTETACDNPVTVNMSIPGFDNTDRIIIYTDDGSDPVRGAFNAKEYKKPFFIGSISPCTIKARAYINDWLPSSDSDVASKTYTVARTVYCAGTYLKGMQIRACLWKNGSFIALDAEGVSAVATSASAVYDDGTTIHVSGVYQEYQGVNLVSHACAWQIDASENVTFVKLNIPLAGTDSWNSAAGRISATSSGVKYTGYFSVQYIDSVVDPGNGDPTYNTYCYLYFPCYWSSSGSVSLPSGMTIPAQWDDGNNIQKAAALEKQGVCNALAINASLNQYHAGDYAKLAPVYTDRTWRHRASSSLISDTGNHVFDCIADSSEVYFFGYSETGSVRKAAYWNVSNTRIYINDGPYGDSFYAIDRTRKLGSNYYCIGYRRLTSNKYNACYWYGDPDTATWNLVDLYLPASVTNDSFALDIAKYGSYIYVAGYKVVESKQVSCIWINGVEQPIIIDGTFTIKGIVVR
jgi:Chitobiase/beta-hexosaminidase C-terminal domain/Fn3 associated